MGSEKDTDKDTDKRLRVFTSNSGGPQATFPLVLTSVTVAVIALHLDGVVRYSETAFMVGVVLALIFSTIVGKVIGASRAASSRTALALVLPAVFGASIGVVVQAIVLYTVGPGWYSAVQDLGGLVDTTQPVLWLASGIVLGGVPAIVVSVFLLLAARALRRITGHDASERFAVPFTGVAGVLAAFGLAFVDRSEAAPLVFVVTLAAITLLVAWLVDGSRMKLLQDVFAGRDGSFEIVPVSSFAANPSLAPLVADAKGLGATSVLVRVAKNPGSYRAPAAEPIALVADTVEASIQPLRYRRLAAAAMLGAMAALGVVASAAHGIV